MTVRQLIEELSMFPPEMEVFHGCDVDGFPVEEVCAKQFRSFGIPYVNVILE